MKVGGDIRGLAPLVKLTVLELCDIDMAGNVQGLAPLLELTHNNKQCVRCNQAKRFTNVKHHTGL